MDKKLAGKVALVTGASRGIGRTIAEYLANHGAKVVINFANRADQAAEVVQNIQRNGGEAAQFRPISAEPRSFPDLHHVAQFPCRETSGFFLTLKVPLAGLLLGLKTRRIYTHLNCTSKFILSAMEVTLIGSCSPMHAMMCSSVIFKLNSDSICFRISSRYVAVIRTSYCSFAQETERKIHEWRFCSLLAVSMIMLTPSTYLFIIS